MTNAKPTLLTLTLRACVTMGYGALLGLFLIACVTVILGIGWLALNYFWWFLGLFVVPFVTYQLGRFVRFVIRDSQR